MNSLGFKRNQDSAHTTGDLIDTLIGPGRLQIFVTILLSLPIFTHIVNSVVEGMPSVSGWWCAKPPNLRHWSHKDWILYSHTDVMNDVNALQLIKDESFIGCLIYDYDYSKLGNINFMEAEEIKTNKTVRCPYGIYYSHKQGQSLTEKFHKGCDDKSKNMGIENLMGSIGRIVGCVFFGWLGDKIGRKRVIFISCGVTPLTGIIISLASQYEAFLMMRVVHNIFLGGLAMCFILIGEVSTNTWRTGLMAIGTGCYAIGFGLTPSLMKIFDTYSQMIAFINIPCLVIFVSSGFIPESPSWLFCVRKITQLEDVILKAAKVNHNPIATNFKLVHVDCVDERQRISRKAPSFWSFVFTSELSCEVIGLTYLTIFFAMLYGSTFNDIIKNVVQSHVAYMMFSITTAVGFVVSQVCILLMGHRRFLQITIGLVFISSMTLMVHIRDTTPTLLGPTITTLMANTVFVSLGYGVILNYNARTIPTRLRGTYFGVWRGIWTFFVWVGRHNYIHFPGVAITLVITSLIAALFSINIHDLYGRELPDTLYDCINFKYKSKPKRWDISKAVEVIMLKEEIIYLLERPNLITVANRRLQSLDTNHSSRVPRV